MSLLLDKCYNSTTRVLRFTNLASSIILLTFGIFGTLWGILGALTINTPPFDPSTYVDHNKAPIRAKNFLHLNPFTLIFYNGILILIGSMTGLTSCISAGALATSVHLGTLVTSLTAEFLIGYSLYWDRKVMRKMMRRTEDAMQSYNQGPTPGLWFLNLTDYWDLMQESVSGIEKNGGRENFKFHAFCPAQRDCCGLVSRDDWSHTPFYVNQNKSFPPSCCEKNDDPTARCGFWTVGKYDEVIAVVKTRGCLSTFPEVLTTEFEKYSLVPTTVGALLVVSTCAALLSLLLRIIQSRWLKLDLDEGGKVKNLAETWDNGAISEEEDAFSESSGTSRKTEVGKGDDLATGKNGGLATPENSTEKFYQSASRNLGDQARRIGSTARSQISNFLFPSTSSVQSYIRYIFRGRNRRNRTAQSENGKDRNIFPVSGHTTEDDERGEPNLVVVSLESRCDEEEGGKVNRIVPSLVSIPVRKEAETVIFRNEVIISRTKFGFGDRKISSSDESGDKSIKLGKKKSGVRSLFPFRVGSNRIHPESRDSFQSLYRHGNFDPNDLGDRHLSSRANSLEGLFISPSDESVQIILNPMFDDSSSESPTDNMSEVN